MFFFTIFNLNNLNHIVPIVFTKNGTLKNNKVMFIVMAMSKLLILYYSKTGNTEKMARAVLEGVKMVEGVDVDLKFQVSADELRDVDALVIGMPTYHHDMTRSMKNLLEELAFKRIDLKGKIGACFGSYGWSGEAPRLILEVMEKKFEMAVLKPPLLIKDTPDELGLEQCRNLGKKVVEQLLPSTS